MVSKKELQNTIDLLHNEIETLKATADSAVNEKNKAEIEKNKAESHASLMASLVHMSKEMLRDESAEEDIAGRLIHIGAFDVAKSYIDFLKGRPKKLEEVKAEKPKKKHVTVSPAGGKPGRKNNRADFGPRTDGTKTGGLQEAIDEAEKSGKDVKLVD